MISIMQPTFLPWLGYFYMISESDKFVFLDSVQFNKRSWQQRNKIKTANGEFMLTIPVLSKGEGQQSIKDVKINRDQFKVAKYIRTIESNYKNAPFFQQYAPQIFKILEKNISSLSSLNMKLIKYFCDAMGISTSFYLSSELNSEGSKADLLASICEELGEVEYFSALGSKLYIEESDAFTKRGIKVFYNDYKHPRYRQLHGDFIPHLGIIDLLLNEGDNSLKVIKGN